MRVGENFLRLRRAEGVRSQCPVPKVLANRSTSAAIDLWQVLLEHRCLLRRCLPAIDQRGHDYRPTRCAGCASTQPARRSLRLAIDDFLLLFIFSKSMTIYHVALQQRSVCVPGVMFDVAYSCIHACTISEIIAVRRTTMSHVCALDFAMIWPF